MRKSIRFQQRSVCLGSRRGRFLGLDGPKVPAEGDDEAMSWTSICQLDKLGIQMIEPEIGGRLREA